VHIYFHLKCNLYNNMSINQICMFEVLTVATMKSIVLLDEMLCYLLEVHCICSLLFAGYLLRFLFDHENVSLNN
jgi:hypothetical protein